LRAIQNSEESPKIAPSVPASMMSPSVRPPPAAIVEAAASVVSSGEDRDHCINQTSSRHVQVRGCPVMSVDPISSRTLSCGPERSRE
jgi:hypothetical protein